MSINALAMPFQDPAGDNHPAAVWLPGTVIMDNLDKTGGVDWVAYHSPAALAAGDTPVQGGQHHMSIDPALYAQVMAFPVQAGGYDAATEAALTYLAQNVKDTPGVSPDETPQVDAQGKPVMVPFFQSAQVVQIG